MFAKLLKYDMKSIGKIGIPTFIVSLIAGVVGFFISAVLATLLFFLDEVSIWNINLYVNEAPQFIRTLSDIVMTLYNVATLGSAFALFAVIFLLSLLGTVILVVTVVNFYKSLLTDEGYLTFTLPVSPTAILASKIVNATIWNVLGLTVQVIFFFAMVIPFIITSIISNVQYSIEAIPQGWITYTDVIYEATTFLGIIATVISTLLFAVVAIITTQLLYFFATFLGGVIANKHKLIASAGFVIIAHVVFTALQQGVQFITTVITSVFGIIFAAVDVLLSDLIGISLGIFIPSTLLIAAPITNLISMLIFGAIAVVLFILTNYLMNKKLNLP